MKNILTYAYTYVIMIMEVIKVVEIVKKLLDLITAVLGLVTAIIAWLSIKK